MELTGQRSGRLTALQRLDEKKRGNEVWLARCDCGKCVKVIASDFLHGRIKSCGCARKGKNVRDLRNMQFSNLTAIERLSEKKGSSYLWLCKCSCGNTTTASAAELTSGRKKSCGCLKTAHCKQMAKDIAGQRFGKLTALYATKKRAGGSVVWVCKCECGRLCEASYNELKAGNQKSCGCLKNEHAAPAAFQWEELTAQAYRQRRIRSDNTSGYTGVQQTRSGKWHAYIMVHKRTYHLGTYSDLQQAVFVRRRAEDLVLGQSEEQVAQTLRQMLCQINSQPFCDLAAVLAEAEKNQTKQEEIKELQHGG